MSGIDRIKQLASEIKDKPLLKIIDYLVSRNDMDQKYLNEEKSLKQMVEFIRDNAKEQATNGVAMIEDEVVYGWAIHYFDESNEDLKLSTNFKNDSTENKQEVNTTKKVTKKREVKPEGQLTLFDLI